MATKTAQAIYDEILAHIQNRGGSFSTWYAGITENIDERLFGAHKVSREKNQWVYRKAASADDTRSVEKALLDNGCDGGDGGGDSDAVFVYAYKKTVATEP